MAGRKGQIAFFVLSVILAVSGCAEHGAHPETPTPSLRDTASVQENPEDVIEKFVEYFNERQNNQLYSLYSKEARSSHSRAAVETQMRVAEISNATILDWKTEDLNASPPIDEGERTSGKVFVRVKVGGVTFNRSLKVNLTYRDGNWSLSEPGMEERVMLQSEQRRTPPAGVATPITTGGTMERFEKYVNERDAERLYEWHSEAVQANISTEDVVRTLNEAEAEDVEITGWQIVEDVSPPYPEGSRGAMRVNMTIVRGGAEETRRIRFDTYFTGQRFLIDRWVLEDVLAG